VSVFLTQKNLSYNSTMLTKLKKTILALLMLFALTSCEEYFRTEKAPHSWEGAITSIIGSVISSAHAVDGICLSTCTIDRCAHLIVHTNSTTSETVCSTNATARYKFDFTEDPNEYYSGKLIEILIIDADDELNNRSYIEVVDKNAPVKIKDLSAAESIVSTAIKGQILKAIDESVIDLRSTYDEALSYITISRINDTLNILAGSGANLLSDLSDNEKVRKAIKLSNQLDPVFLGRLMSMYQESEAEGQVFTNIKTLCNDEHSNLTGEENLMNSNLPSCYLSKSSIASGSLLAWSPISELLGECIFNSGTSQATCTDPDSGLMLIGLLPSEPVNITDYVLASDYLANNYTSNSCATGYNRSGGSYIIDTSIQLVLSHTGPTTVSLTHNPFYVLKTYSECLNDQTANINCTAVLATPGIKTLQLSLIEDGFCY